MTKRPVQLYAGTYDTINKNKGEKNIATFIDDAVNYYILSFGKQSEFAMINEQLKLIRETQRTILGVNCEVLRQAGILNGNGEVTFKKND